MATIISREALPGGITSRQFEGYLHEDANISFFLSNTPPGRGPKLHQHPYEEIFVVYSGTLTFTVGDETIEVSGETIVIVPPGTAHQFVNSGKEIAHHIDIHVSPRMVTEWLEE
jgi:mannose-6-phosphate isomerase-like protein (cupin superfamily)